MSNLSIIDRVIKRIVDAMERKFTGKMCIEIQFGHGGLRQMKTIYEEKEEMERD